MEVTQGVRTRARAAAEATDGSKRRTAPAEILLSKRRRFVNAHQISTSPVNSRSSTPRPSPERGGISRCSSNGSLMEGEEGAEEQLRSSSAKRTKSLEDLELAAYIFECSRDRETTPSSNRLDQYGDLESTAGRKDEGSAPSAAMPLQEEIEDFFAAAEKAEKRRFADKYNYDVDRDVPLDGRYEWVRLKA